MNNRSLHHFHLSRFGGLLGVFWDRFRQERFDSEQINKLPTITEQWTPAVSPKMGIGIFVIELLLKNLKVVNVTKHGESER